MRLSNLGKSLLFGAIFALAQSFAPAQGAFIATETSSVNPLAGGLFLYSYTVTVSASSTVSASEFDLSLGAAIDPNSIVNPSNFISFYTVGDPFISFTAFTNGTTLNGIAPGSSGTFSFVSAFGPSAGSYSASGFDPNSGSNPNPSIQGAAVVPGAVPEPSSLLMSSLAVCGTLGLFARSRRRLAV